MRIAWSNLELLEIRQHRVVVLHCPLRTPCTASLASHSFLSYACGAGLRFAPLVPRQYLARNFKRLERLPELVGRL